MKAHQRGIDGRNNAMVSEERRPRLSGSMESFNERRRSPRYKALKESLLAFRCASHEETEGDAAVLDLSKGGCRITTEVPLALSSYYRLVLQATAGHPVTIETAVVCWRSKSVYGLKFVTVGEDQEELLEQNLLQLRSLT
jgi:c-di-GMP-binding flagellar brake protein YcgR